MTDTSPFPSNKSLHRQPEGRALYLVLFAVFIGTVALDQISKIHVHRTMVLWEDASNTSVYRGDRTEVFTLGERRADLSSNFFGLKIHYSRNKGAAFSMFEDLPDHIRTPLFHGVTVIALVLMVQMFLAAPMNQYLTRLGLALVCAGAVGNAWDRLRLGYVVDMLDTDWNLWGWYHDFAIFNVADVAINIGVIMLFIDIVVHYIQTKTGRLPAPA